MVGVGVAFPQGIGLPAHTPDALVDVSGTVAVGEAVVTVQWAEVGSDGTVAFTTMADADDAATRQRAGCTLRDIHVGEVILLQACETSVAPTIREITWLGADQTLRLQVWGMSLTDDQFIGVAGTPLVSVT